MAGGCRWRLLRSSRRLGRSARRMNMRRRLLREHPRISRDALVPRQWLDLSPFASGAWLGGAPGAAGQVDADVEVQVLGQQVLEFAAFDDAQPVVAGGEGFSFRAYPCGGDEDSGGRPLFFYRPRQGAYVVGGHAVAVPLGLDQYLGTMHDVGLVVGDGVDPLIARTE
jgi:hypothetical protein